MSTIKKKFIGNDQVGYSKILIEEGQPLRFSSLEQTLNLYAPSGLEANRSVTLPASAPTNGYLVQTDASGVWSYVNPASLIDLSVYLRADGSVALTGNLAPNVDNTLALGATDNRFSVVFASNLNAGAGDLSFQGEQFFGFMANGQSPMLMLHTEDYNMTITVPYDIEDYRGIVLPGEAPTDGYIVTTDAGGAWSYTDPASIVDLSDVLLKDGSVALLNDAWLKARNAADDADIDIIKVGANDYISLGNGAPMTVVANGIDFSGVSNAYFGNSGISGQDLMINADTLGLYTSGQINIATLDGEEDAVAASVLINAGNGVGATGSGGDINITSGQGSNAGNISLITSGTISIGSHSSDAAPLMFFSDEGNFNLILQVPNDLTDYRSITLPGNAPSQGHVVTTDAAGVWSYQPLPASASQYKRERIEITPQMVLDQKVTLQETPEADSVMLFAGGLLQDQTVDYDVTGDEVSFKVGGDIHSGGPAALVSGDVIYITYTHA